MRPDDAVESVECHAEYEASAAHCSDKEGWGCENAEPELVGRHRNIHGSVKISTETCQYKCNQIEPRVKTETLAYWWLSKESSYWLNSCFTGSVLDWRSPDLTSLEVTLCFSKSRKKVIIWIKQGYKFPLKSRWTQCDNVTSRWCRLSRNSCFSKHIVGCLSVETYNANITNFVCFWRFGLSYGRIPLSKITELTKYFKMWRTLLQTTTFFYHETENHEKCTYLREVTCYRSQPVPLCRGKLKSVYCVPVP